VSRNIVYLSPYFWPEEIGSAPYATELALWLGEQGHNLHVVSFRPHYPNVGNFAAWSDGARDEEELSGIRITRIAVTERGTGGFKERVKNDLRFLLSVWGRALRGRFRGTDLVVAYVPSVLTLLGAMLIQLLTTARVVAVVHDIESGLAKSLGLASNRAVLFAMNMVERLAFNRCDQIIVLTEGMRSELRKIGCRRPISVISIWASLAPEAPASNTSPVTLMYSGNFGKKQNLDQLVPLLKKLSDKRPNIRVVLQGDGSEKARIEELFSAEGISNTQFMPLVAANELVPSLQAASIHLVPQALNVANYALPSKIFSAMSVGRPFVCIAENDSPLDQVTRQSAAGLCVSPQDEEGLFEAVVSLAEDFEDQRIKGRNGRQFVSTHLSKEIIMEEYHKVLLDAGR
jgi:colanic acid biosynthesis glycosyl transferase WcaI